MDKKEKKKMPWVPLGAAEASLGTLPKNRDIFKGLSGLNQKTDGKTTNHSTNFPASTCSQKILAHLKISREIL